MLKCLRSQSNFSEHESIVDVSPYLRISAAQGLDIPVISYTELPIMFLGHTFSAMGFLIVRDPVGITLMVRKKADNAEKQAGEDSEGREGNQDCVDD